eukprot:6796756-Lingulodinium_polyedra.AAC.1
MTARRAPSSPMRQAPSPNSREQTWRSMPSARWTMSWRRFATARHSPSAQAALSTRRGSDR